MTWEQAKAKLCTLFPDEEERGRIRGILLGNSVNERLEYFEGGDTEIAAALRTLLPIQGKDLNPQVLKEIQRKVDRLDEMMMKRARISSEAVIPSLSYSNAPQTHTDLGKQVDVKSNSTSSR